MLENELNTNSVIELELESIVSSQIEYETDILDELNEFISEQSNDCLEFINYSVEE